MDSNRDVHLLVAQHLTQCASVVARTEPVLATEYQQVAGNHVANVEGDAGPIYSPLVCRSCGSILPLDSLEVDDPSFRMVVRFQGGKKYVRNHPLPARVSMRCTCGKVRTFKLPLECAKAAATKTIVRATSVLLNPRKTENGALVKRSHNPFSISLDDFLK
ncbi:hypothetical protein GMRT_11691 [Giardia muris]|uniref:Uncharacterized protein n=1 Tax=Giardia muris TaxID=5742 RepID=A0A4Z1SUK1_GIAMU|nr:hypothetical protein GMRT_11691 [Giardia muris]|eukprot:TNJ29514.1 hypothetical protein GMRT_11691 [Giardia muris]